MGLIGRGLFGVARNDAWCGEKRLLVWREAALGVGSWLTAAVCSTPVGRKR